MIRNVHLHGVLKEKFGGPFRLDIASAGEAYRALACQLEGFHREFISHDYRVIRGPDPDHGLVLGEKEMAFRLGRADLHFMPVVAGSKSGVGKILGGVAIAALAVVTAGAAAAAAAGVELGADAGIVAGASALDSISTFSMLGSGLAASTSFGITYGQVALFGVGLALMGLGQMLAPHPTTVNPNPSFLYGGPANTSAQGGAVPPIYGTVRVGSVVISSGMDIAQNAVFPMQSGL